MKFLILLMLFSFTGCANYVKSVHRDLDGNSSKKANKDNFDLYRKKKRGNLTDKITLSKNSEDAEDFEPRIKRNYKPVTKARVSALDLQDNESSGSLWNSETADGYLFSRDVFKKNGDIIVVKVQHKLKNDITAELKRAFPAPKKKVIKEDKEKDKKDPATADATKKDDAAATKEEEAVSDETKIYDHISSVVIEEVNKEYILLRGQKEVIFRSNKHFVEIQALIPRREILEDDTVLSSNILESNISIAR